MRGTIHIFLAGWFCLVSVTGAWAETPPTFPPGTTVGEPPGFDGPPEKEKESDASQIGTIAANVGYGLSGLLTYFSVKRLPAAVRQTASAATNLAQHSARETWVGIFTGWGDALEKKKPIAMARLEKAVTAYEKATAPLGAHILSLAPQETLEQKALEIDVHLDRFLTLPLLARRTTLREELKGLVAVWKKDRDAGPLEKWIVENREYDVIRTTNGQAWLRLYQGLREEFAALSFKEKHSPSEMEKWLRSSLASGAGEFVRWRRKYASLKAKEQTAAEKFVKSANASLPHLLEAARQEVLLPPAVSREPGQFLFNGRDGTGVREVNASGVVPASGASCDSLLAAIAKKRAKIALEADRALQVRSLVWPLAPVAVGTGVGGYYSLEGVRYWLEPKTP